METSPQLSRADLELMAQARLELQERRIKRLEAEPLVYGIFRPNGEYGGEHLYSVQEQQGHRWEYTDKPYHLTIPERLEPVLYASQRFVVLYGGRGGAKSQTVADILLGRARDRKSKVLCLREYQNSIEDSSLALLLSEIQRLSLPHFTDTKTTIRRGNRDHFRFRGIARDPEAVKSAHGFQISWVEEAQTLSAHSLKLLTPTIRESRSQLVFTLNLGSSEDPMSQRFIKPFQDQLDRCGYYEDDLHLIIKINYSDNPWHRNLEAERVWDEKNLPPLEYRHIWEGDFSDSVPGNIIQTDWFEAAVDAHLKLGFEPVGAKVVAHDPSDQGGDAKGIAVLHGSVLLDVDEMLTEAGLTVDVNTGMDMALQRMHDERGDHFTWDTDGLGLGLRAQVQRAAEGKPWTFSEFRGGSGVIDPDKQIDPDAPGGKTNKDAYPNRRSQSYMQLAARFYNTWQAVELGRYMDPDKLISVSSEIKKLDKLRAELCRIPRKDNNRGMHQVMGKPDMLRLFGIKSPNMADAVMMATASKGGLAGAGTQRKFKRGPIRYSNAGVI